MRPRQCTPRKFADWAETFDHLWTRWLERGENANDHEAQYVLYQAARILKGEIG